MYCDSAGKSIVLVLLLVGSSIPMIASIGAAPMGLESGYAVKADTITIGVKGAQLEYETTAIEAEPGTELTIRLKNEGTLPHNIVLLEEEADVESIGMAALRAEETEYVPMDMEDQIVGYTSMAQPGETVTFTITVPPPGEYTYLCTYPGHFRTMQGVLTSVE